VRRRPRNDAVNFTIEPATPDVLAEVATWVYGPPYEFYDRDTDGHVKNPERFFAARDQEGALVGFSRSRASGSSTASASGPT